jgi:hypothetical protein
VDLVTFTQLQNGKKEICMTTTLRNVVLLNLLTGEKHAAVRIWVGKKKQCCQFGDNYGMSLFVFEIF